MSGLWDRIVPGEDRVAVHFITAAVHLAVEGVFTNAQILAAINSDLDTDLDSAAESDLSDLVTECNAQPNIGAKARYIHLIESLGLAVEEGHLTSESVWRSNLGIT